MLTPSIFRENLFDDFFDFLFFDDKEQKKLERKLCGYRGKNLMKTDIKKTDSGYKLEMDLPGFAKNEVKVSPKDGMLTISASRGLDQDEQEKKIGRCIHRERYAGAYKRSFYVGENPMEVDIKGEFKYGILKLFVPKKEVKSVVEEKKYITME